MAKRTIQMMLTPDDQKRIEEEEQYRATVRQRMAESPAKGSPNYKLPIALLCLAFCLLFSASIGLHLGGLGTPEFVVISIALTVFSLGVLWGKRKK